MYFCVREWEGAKIKLIKRDYQNACVQEHVHFWPDFLFGQRLASETVPVSTYSQMTHYTTALRNTLTDLRLKYLSSTA